MTLKSDLPQIADRIEAAVQKAVKVGAETVAQSARDRVDVDSGRLRDRIHTESDDDGVYVVAGDREAFYGHMVEHGTRHSAPRPFLVPALEENRKTVEEDIAAAIREAT